MPKQKWTPRMKPRIVVIFYAMVLLVFYLSYNLVQVQARQRAGNHDLALMALHQHVGVMALPALRGAILDRNRMYLATSLSLPSVAANPRILKEKGNLAVAGVFMQNILGRPLAQINSLLATRGTFVWLARKVPERMAEQIEKLKMDGLFILREPTGKRFYPKGRLAVHILGYTGIDDNGLDGVEGVFDAVLRGKPGELAAEMDRDGRVIPHGWSRRRPARPGHNLVLTIDESIQYIAERELGAAVRRHHARGGVCIVMDVKTGDILAMVNKPDYPTTNFDHVPAKLRRNGAVADSYEPGSTFKIVVAAAALDSGKISMTDRFFCGDSINVDGWTIHNADDGASSATGAEDITGIITNSYNVGTTSVAMRIGKKTMFDYMLRFGFGYSTGISLPGETEGIVQPLAGWAKCTLATNSFGQGVAVTPLQLASAMQAIANQGVQMKPRLVKEIVDTDGKVVRTFPPVVRRRVISEETSRNMRAILRNVVVNGTGTKAEIPGYPAAGKTGTAQVCNNGVYCSGRYIGSFLGFAPVQNPRIVCMVKIEEPRGGLYWGGYVAGPVFRAVGRESLWRLGVRPVAVVAHKKVGTND